MTTKNSVSNKFLSIALASGLLFGLLLIFMPHGIGTTNSYSDLVIVLASQLFSVVVAALLASWMLKSIVANSYIVSIFAVLYLYAFSRLIAFARLFNDTLYVVLLVLISLVLFYLSNLIFNRHPAGKTKKMVGVSVLLIAFVIACAVFGLTLTRAIAPLVV